MLEPSSHERALNLRCRADLEVTPVVIAGTRTWMVKDPLTLDHHHLTEEEFFLLDRLRGDTSLADLRRHYERRFTPARISHAMIWRFISRSFESGLLLSTAPGQGAELLRRDRRQQMRRRSLAWTRILALRFRGINPDAWLTTVYDRCGWLISWWTLAVVVGVVLFAGWLIVGHFGEFWSRLPELSALCDLRNLFWLMLALAAVKVLHELGHALACKHFGGEVPELGFMLLAFTPCLYCDVSDAWRLANRWHRMAITAAGILVEFVLAAMAIIVWWYSQPGTINLVALDIVIVCTASTLLINGNPLLRYDGYYLLSDLAETPNLWQRSRQVLADFAGRFVFGLQAQGDVMIPARHRLWLALYAMASKIYLVVVVLSIVWMLVQVLSPLRLQNVAYGVGLLVLGSSLLVPAQSAVQLLRNPLRRRQIRTPRVATVLGVTLTAVAVLLAMPLAYPVYAPAMLLPAEATRIYTTVGGRLLEATPPGQPVAHGDVIARMENTDVQRELLQLAGEKRLSKLRVEHLHALRTSDPTAGDKIPAAQAAVAALDNQLQDRQQDLERLTLRTPVSGVVLPVPATPQPSNHPDRLPSWSGSALDDENVSAWLEPGTLLCWIGDPQTMEAVLLVADAEAQRLRIGQHVRLAFDQLPTSILTGEVCEISRRASAARRDDGTVDAPVEKLLTGITPAGHQDTNFQVQVQLQPTRQRLIPGGRGQAKIITAPMRIGERLVRFFTQTFQLPL